MTTVGIRATFLGTAASEGYPDAFCPCERCIHARSLGGPSLRKRSSVLINTDLIVDLGPDVMAASAQHNVPLSALEYCLQTHEHRDHLDASHFLSRSADCGVFGVPRLHFYGTAGAVQKASQSFPQFFNEDGTLTAEGSERLNLTLCLVEPCQFFAVGPYRVHSVRANHDMQNITAMLYVVERDGRTLFYGTDTGPLPEETWVALRAAGHRCNVVILDHTFGLAQRATGHMNQEQFLEQVARLRAEGLLAPDVRIFAHHLAHHSNPAHPELTRIAADHGYCVPYDGLVITV